MIQLPVNVIDGIPVEVEIVPKGNIHVRPANPMNPTFITIHNTGNSGKGANADMHAKYLYNQADHGTRWASWHFSVDEHRIIQHIPLNENAWHTGDGSGSRSGNMTSIGIEICENSDGNYAKAEANAVALTHYLMELYGFDISRVKPHQHWSGKYCPHIILSRGGGFSTFTTAVNKYRGGMEVVIPSSPKPTSNVVKRGDKGEEVRFVQSRLKAHGYSIVVDGLFGANTEKVVRIFQEENGLKVDGIVGKNTMAKLKLSKAEEGKEQSVIGKRVESIHDGELNIRSKPDFKAKSVFTIKKGWGFPKILDVVNDGSMYKVANSKGAVYYITASPKYVKVEGVAKPQPKPEPKKPSIPVKGHIVVDGVNNYTYIYSDTKASKKLAKAYKNAKYPIAGSTSEFYEVIYEGKRAYIRVKYCSQV